MGVSDDFKYVEYSFLTCCDSRSATFSQNVYACLYVYVFVLLFLHE